MAKYNYNTESCHQCGELVLKGEGLWFWADGRGRTFCLPCGNARLKNRAIGASRRAHQPSLFDQL